MSIQRRVRLITCIAGVVALLASGPRVSLADVVTKKDGRTVEGTITEKSASQVVVQTKFGAVTIPMADVAKIEEGGASPADDFKRRWEEVDKKDPIALNELAEWCAESGLGREKAKVYRAILEVDPDHENARRALGFSKVNGEWKTKAEIEAEDKRRKDDERKEKEAAKKAATDKLKGGKATKPGSPSAKAGGALDADVKSFVDVAENNREADAKAAKEMGDFFGLKVNSMTTQRFSIRAELPPDEVKRHAALAEKLVVSCNRWFGLEPEFAPWKGEFIYFHVRQQGTFVDLIDWVDKNLRQMDPEEKKHYKDGGNFHSFNPSPLAAGFENSTPLEQKMAHIIPQIWIEWYSGGGAAMHPWLGEGFAAYAATDTFGANRVYCTTQTKYTGKTEIADKDADNAYQLVCFDLIDGRLEQPHPWIEIIKKDLNKLDYADLAKSWSIVDMLMKEHPEEFNRYVLECRKYKNEEECLQAVFGWTSEDLETKWKEYVTSHYSRTAAKEAGGDKKKKKP